MIPMDYWQAEYRAADKERTELRARLAAAEVELERERNAHAGTAASHSRLREDLAAAEGALKTVSEALSGGGPTPRDLAEYALELHERLAAAEKERDDLRERMGIVLRAGPSTALAVSVFDRAKRAEAASAQMREVLRPMEFINRKCPHCAGWNIGPNGETIEKHTPDCRLAAALSSEAGRGWLSPEQVAARDMKVAEAVREECADSFNGPDDGWDAKEAIRRLDLSALLEKLP